MSALHSQTAAALAGWTAKTRGVLGYSVLDLTSGERFDHQEDLVFPQASAIKIPILMEVCRQAHAEKFRLTDTRRIDWQHKTGGTGILSELGNNTVEMSLHDFCVLMIVLSDNTATNLLLDLVGMDNVNATLDGLGLTATRVRRRMFDTEASWRGDENTSTPAEAVRILEKLHRSEFVSRTVSAQVLTVMKKAKSSNLRNGLPPEVVMAGKPGGIAGVQTEWGIVYAQDRPYAVAVMENYGLGDAPEVIKGISRTLYEHFHRLGQATPHGAFVEKPRPK